MIKVLKAGLETSVQDQGRIGYYSLAYPPSGALDIYSYTIANLLVGNDKNASALEFTFLGPVLEFQQDSMIAITGGLIPPKLNGEVIPMWTNIPVRKGDILSFDIVQGGARAYIAVRGGIKVDTFLNSSSTYSLVGIGGYNGRTLKEGDLLEIGDMSSFNPRQGVNIPEEYLPEFSKHHEIRVVPGLTDYRLDMESKNRFFNTEWTVSNEANRMGYRLKGEQLDFVPRDQPFGAGNDASNVVDMGNPPGAIQIPNAQELIVVLKDVTTSGFVTIGTVISVDLDRMGQIKPNEKVKFRSVSIEEALEARKISKEKIYHIEENLIGKIQV